MEVSVFFEKCKVQIKTHAEYLSFMNHYTDVLHGEDSFNSSIKQYPVYVFLDDSLNIEYTYDKNEYERRKIKNISLSSFQKMKFVVSHHFRNRFDERFEKVSDTRFKKIVGNMLQRGSWLKRKDTIKLIKYKKTSDYVLFSRYEVSDKKYYLVVLTNRNILTTIYEFDIKDLKFFKES